MLIRFATLCDKCDKRSEEYTAFPTCEHCMDDVCPDCYVPNSFTNDERNQAVCNDCADKILMEFL